MKSISLITSVCCVLTTALAVFFLHSCREDGAGCTGIQNCDYRFTTDDKQWVYVNTNPVYNLFDTAHKKIKGKDSIVIEPKADVTGTIVVYFSEIGAETNKCCSGLMDNATVNTSIQANLNSFSSHSSTTTMYIARGDNGLSISANFYAANPVPSYNDTALVNSILYTNVKKITFRQPTSTDPYFPKFLYYAKNYGVIKYMLNNGAYLALKKQ